MLTNKNNILKYIVYGMIIYLSFNYIPKNKLHNNDIIIISSIILITYILFDNISSKKEHMTGNIFQDWSLDIQNLGKLIKEPSETEGKKLETTLQHTAETEGKKLGPTFQHTAETLQHKTSDVANQLLGDIDTEGTKLGKTLGRATSSATHKIINSIDILGDTPSDSDGLLNDSDTLPTTLPTTLPKDSSDHKDKLINNLMNKLDTQAKCNCPIDKEKKDNITTDKSNLDNKLSNTEASKIATACESGSSTKKCLQQLTNLQVSNGNTQHPLLNVLIKNKILSTDDSNKLLNTCKTNMNECKKLLSNMVHANKLTAIRASTLLKSFVDKQSEPEEKRDLNKLVTNKTILNNSLKNIAKTCSKDNNNKQCTQLIRKLMTNNIISAEEMADNINIACGNNGSSDLCKKVLNEYVDNDYISTNMISKNIAQSCGKNGNPDKCSSRLKELINDNIITQNLAEQICPSCIIGNSDHLIRKNNHLDIQNNRNNTNLPLENNDKGNDNSSSLQQQHIDDPLLSTFAGSEMKYTDYNKKFFTPIGNGLGNWDTSDTMLNTDKWTVPIQRPPVCKSEKVCPVCPITPIGYPLNLKEWDTSRRFTPSMGINTKYVEDVLN